MGFLLPSLTPDHTFPFFLFNLTIKSDTDAMFLENVLFGESASYCSTFYTTSQHANRNKSTMTVTMVEVAMMMMTMMMMTMMMMTMVLEEAMKEGWALGINPLIVTIGARVMMKKVIFYI